ncbi:hypothetical protein [Streptomyces sp. YGL11-2]|uniref:hypothetical protein n=1 Tax=Streptomyces sp. YGL11-2 TaxID=3414028 RepID=UPI003CF6B853
MSRGRHRHSPPLHRLLPPSTVAGASIACAAGAWFVGDDLVQRVLAAGAAAAAVTGAVLLRTWDRKAGKRVADLTRARARDEWRTEERIAELETDVEESREIRAALDTKLRAKRAELARLRSEHAELLRRYATAETERASALEGRRLLAIEAGAPDAPDAPDTAKSAKSVNGANAADAAKGADRAETADVAAAAASGSGLLLARRESANGADRAPARRTATFAEADRALCRLATNAARQREAAGNRRSQSRPKGRAEAPVPAQAKAAGGRHAKESQDGGNGQGKHEAAGQGKPGAAVAQRTGGDAQATRTGTPGGLALRPVPAAAAAIAPPRPTVTRTLGGFDFFGNASVAPRQLTAPLEDDLADVVGDEAVAEQSARAEARTARTEAAEGARTAEAAEETDEADAVRPEGGADGAAADAPSADGAATVAPSADGATTHGAGEVIDLTAHDETEQLDLAELRSAIS